MVSRQPSTRMVQTQPVSQSTAAADKAAPSISIHRPVSFLAAKGSPHLRRIRMRLEVRKAQRRRAKKSPAEIQA